jgi:hypothetical protein
MKGLVKGGDPSERRTLSNADPRALRRLARYKRLPVPSCGCGSCFCKLIEHLARVLQ